MKKNCIHFLALSFIVIYGCQQSANRQFAEQLYEAYQKGDKIPNASSELNNLTDDDAYVIQKQYVTKRMITERVIGYKAGLTSATSQQKFNVSEPLAGVLFQSGLKKVHSVIKMNEYNDLRIEVEIGFIFKQEITNKISSITALKETIKKIAPAIELPDLGFNDMTKLNSVDLIAGNVSSKQFIIGDEMDFEDIDLDAMDVTLMHNTLLINSGKGSDAMESQWEAALWLVNRLIEVGYTIEPGNVIITGALGNMIKGESGKYTADYGQLGSITFEVE